MTKRVKKFASTLGYLAKCDKHTCKSIINSAKPELINCFSDICHNLLQGRVNLTDKQKNKLSKYKTYIRRVANRKTTQKAKKTLIQKGGFIGALLAPLLGSVIAPLAQGIFGNRK